MSGKLVFLFMVALCVSQGYTDTSVTEIIRNLEEKIEDVIASLEPNTVHDRVISELKAVTGDTPAINKCIEKNSAGIDKMVEWIIASVTTPCLDDANRKLVEIKTALKEILDKYTAVNADIKARVQKCIDENVGNEEGLAKCLHDQVKPVQDELFELELEVQRISEDAKINAKRTEVVFSNCIYDVNIEIWSQEKVLIDGIKKCAGAQVKYASIENFDKEAVFGFWDTVSKVIEAIKNGIAQLGGNIAEIFKKLQEKINEIMGGMNLNEVINKIIQKIKDVIGNVNTIVNKCIDKQRPAIEALAKESQAASMACVLTAEEKILAIREKVDTLVKAATALKDSVLARATKCFKENILHPTQMIQCFKDQVAEISQELVGLKNEAMKLIEEAKDVAASASVELGNCMAKVGEDVNNKQQAIIDDIQKCVAEN